MCIDFLKKVELRPSASLKFREPTGGIKNYFRYLEAIMEFADALAAWSCNVKSSEIRFKLRENVNFFFRHFISTDGAHK